VRHLQSRAIVDGLSVELGYKKPKLALTFASNQDLLDTLWGYYFATGSHIRSCASCRFCPGPGLTQQSYCGRLSAVGGYY
jgi:hypothetical protein